MVNTDLQLIPDGIGHDDVYIDPVAGDFVIVPSDEQHIKDTVSAFPGWWKQYPADGVGAMQYLNSSGQAQALARAIKLQLQADGYQVNNPKVSYTNNQLIINPDATAPA